MTRGAPASVAAALDAYLLQAAANGRSPHTLGQIERHGKLFIRWLKSEGRSRRLAAITPAVIAAFFVSKEARCTPDGVPKKPMSMNALRSTLRTWFGYLHDGGYVRVNPARVLRPAICAPPPPRGLSDDEMQRLKAAFDRASGPGARRDRALFSLLASSGLRISSALALRVEDLDGEAAEVEVRCMKGGRPDRVPVPRAVVDELVALAGNRGTGPCFVGRGGRPIGRRHFARVLALRAQEASITRPVHPHALRHTLAMRLLRETGDLSLVQAALRHRSIHSTTVYARATKPGIRAALEAVARC